MKRIYIAFLLIAVCIAAGAAELWDVKRIVGECQNGVYSCDGLMIQKENHQAAKALKKCADEFTQHNKNYIYCYFPHSKMEQISTDLEIMREYIRHDDDVSYFAWSAEVKTLLDYLTTGEDITLQNVL